MASGSDEEGEFVKISMPRNEVTTRCINGLVTADLTNYDIVSEFPDFTTNNNLQVIRMPTQYLEDIPNENCKIPNSFCSMKYLLKLCLFGDNVADSGLTCLPRDFGKLKSLEELNLQHNKFLKFPEQICELYNLKKLYLNSCGLKSISVNICGLYNLVEADFSQNDFSGGLPKELFDLPKLKDLYIIDCNLSHLPPEIGNLQQLEGIRVNENKLEELPDELFTLKHLKKLSAHDNKISSLSPKIINLQNLEFLNLKGNNLKVLPEEISKLLNLRVINVLDNKLTCLPDTITEIDSSVQFFIHGNENLQKPPISICTKGIDSIKGFFETMKKDRPVHSNRIKIVMFGEAGAGKTCLTKVLVNCYATDSSKDDSTIGVEIHHWQIEPDGLEASIVDLAGQRQYQLTHPFFLSEEALHILVVNLKEYQKKKESFKRNVEDWINWVTARLLKPRIMIVPTHIDECKEIEIIEKCKDILKRIQDHEEMEIRRLKGEMRILKKENNHHGECVNVEAEIDNLKRIMKYRPFISCRLADKAAKSKNVQEEDSTHIRIVPVSSKQELHGMIPLRDEIKRVVKTKDLFPFVGRDLPESWVNIEKAIKQHRQDVVPPNVPCMTLEEFWKFASETKTGLSGNEVMSVLKHLDSVGEIKFYENVPKNEYSVFLDLQWLCKTVKLLFRHNIFEGVGLEYKEEYAEFRMEKIQFGLLVEELKSKGVLSVDLLRCIWMELELEDVQFNKLIKALVCFGLACELQSNPPALLVPWFLHSEITPEQKEDRFPNTPGSGVVSTYTECKLRYSIPGYLPAGLFDRLCVHCYALGVDADAWKNSMIIYINIEHAPIKIFLDVDDTYITVTGRVESESDKGLRFLWIELLKIVEKIETLLKEWPALAWNTYTVCPHCVKNNASNPHSFQCKWLESQEPCSLRCKKVKLGFKQVKRDLLVPPKDLVRRSMSTQPMPENVPDSLIRKLSGLLPTDWEKLANHLGLSNTDIECITANYGRVEERAYQMLQEWKKKNGSDATRSKLINALVKIGRVDLVEKVKLHIDD